MAAITCARAMGIVSSGSSSCHRVEMMKQIAAALILAVALAAVARTAPQDPQEQRPTFKSSIDLVPVDVCIVDKTGHPVTNLEAKDFSLTIDGRPRRIAPAQYIPAGRDSGPAEPV